MARQLGNLLLASALVVVLGGCGSDGDGTIPEAEANTLIQLLDAVEGAVASGDCDLAEANVQELVSNVNALPEEVDGEVRQGLTQAAANLARLTADPEQCGTTGATGAVDPQTTETETTVPPTTTETTTTETTTDEPPEDEQQPPEDEQPPEDQEPASQPPSDQGPGGGQGGGPPSGGLGPGDGDGRR